MKFWLIALFLTPDGEVVGKREIAYKDEATCYMAMDYIQPPKNMKKATITRAVCVSNDRFLAGKKKPGIKYD